MTALADTLVLFDPLFLEHQPGAGHPERPERLLATLDLLESVPIKGLRTVAPRPATPAELAAVHGAELLRELEQTQGRHAVIDGDTVLSERSYDAAVLAAGAGAAAVEAVMKGEAPNAFALVRPPGHHAEPHRSMGFCLFNNVAIAAEVARAKGAQRVLVMDFDVHHGNGTQACFAARRDVMYQSVHQFPFYPGTGAVEELGTGEGAGYTINCPLPGGQGDADFGAAFEDLFLPIAQAYRPDLVLVSAGYDAHEDDPLGGMQVSERGYAAMTSALRDLAEACCGGKLVLLLEGGYSLGGLSRSVHASLEVLRGRRESFARGTGTEAATAEVISRARTALKGKAPGL